MVPLIEQACIFFLFKEFEQLGFTLQARPVTRLGME